MDREVPEKYIRQQKFFKRKELFWSITHYGLGIVAGVLAVLAAHSAKLGTPTASTLALVSGAVAAVLTFLSPASRRKAYTEARDLMRIARVRFEEEDNRSVTRLIDAMEAASQVTRRR
ncbi:hypothetical protein EXN22_16080 [Pseudomonas tructae]|uniref:SMODS and SLOG-associating 2TM effector domain-containing protein n=1 Tax=Pseudomonas tructae TaxID=2518644 RepID=A0A411MK43_9PSED|nr:hypothetical protein [Pseudomonas tructae]QBF27137.1 hypothetical protein EXN22_16080 [Pseudomonas tructae]